MLRLCLAILYESMMGNKHVFSLFVPSEKGKRQAGFRLTPRIQNDSIPFMVEDILWVTQAFDFADLGTRDPIPCILVRRRVLHAVQPNCSVAFEEVYRWICVRRIIPSDTIAVELC